MTLTKLLGALSTALERLQRPLEPERLERTLLSVGERRELVLTAVRRRGSLAFARLVEDCRTRLEAVVTFLAVLDLLKSEDVRAEQSDAFGEIVLFTRQDGPEAVATA